MKKNKKIVGILLAAAVTLMCSITFGLNMVSALTFSMSPMKQKIVLVPGQTFRGSLKITNPATSDSDFQYQAKVEPVKFDEDYNMSLETTEKYSDIVKWIKVQNPSGIVKPNETVTIYFEINTPEDAPAGGQYAAITVGTVAGEGSGSLNIQQNVQMAHVIYANVAGETVYDTNVSEVEIPSFLFGENISASALVKNGGNSYIDVKHTLQVYPLFSDEEIYTNEEDPEETIVLPETSRRTTSTWGKTPAIGIYRVRYAVLVDDEVAASAEKMVIICPIWLLFIVIFAIVALIIWIVIRVRIRKKAQE